MRRDGFILLPTILLLAVLAAIAYSLARQSGSGLGLESSELHREQAAMLAEAGLARALWAANQTNCINYAATGTKPLGSGNYQASFSATSSSPVKITATGTLTDGSSQQRQIQAAIYSTEQKTGVLQSANFLEATTIDPDNPLSGVPGVLTVSGGGKRALFRIDNNQIDSIVPDGVFVESATLEFHVEPTAADVTKISLYPITSFWNHDRASWVSSDESSTWRIPGGDFVSSVVSSGRRSNANNAILTWDVTALIRGWKSQRLANLGALFSMPTGNDSATLVASSLAENTQNPRLTVVYRCNCGDARCRFGKETDKALAYWVVYPTVDFELDLQHEDGVLGGGTISLRTASTVHMGVYFNFFDKPNIDEIVDVRLNVFSESSRNIVGPLTASAYRITTNWDANSRGWDNQLLSHVIYYDVGYPMGSATISNPIGLQSFYIEKDIVSGWLSGATNNYGMVLFFPNVPKFVPTPRLNISSMENAIVSQRPQLVIAYLPK